jgi:hypothetical protein
MCYPPVKSIPERGRVQRGIELDSQVVDFVKTQLAAAQPAAALDLFCANGSIPQVIAKTC